VQERGPESPVAPGVPSGATGRPETTPGTAPAAGVPAWTLVAVTAVTILVVDQVTKWWALRALDDRVIEVAWTLRLNLVFNTGAAFGLGSRYAPLIALAAAVVVLLLLRTSRALDGVWPRFAVGLVLGGAAGNLADRLLREGEGLLGGAVVDFVDLQWWPVFNVADAAISVGAVLLALTSGPRRPDA
jgi:signal peptidase II